MSYLKLSSDFLADAWKALSEHKETKSEEKLRQACEKGFGAFSQALMHFKGMDLRHKQFRNVVEELFMKTKSYDVLRAHRDAESLHGSFYDGTLSLIEVEDALRQIEVGIQVIAGLK